MWKNVAKSWKHAKSKEIKGEHSYYLILAFFRRIVRFAVVRRSRFVSVFDASVRVRVRRVHLLFGGVVIIIIRHPRYLSTYRLSY